MPAIWKPIMSLFGVGIHPKNFLRKMGYHMKRELEDPFMDTNGAILDKNMTIKIKMEKYKKLQV